MPIAAALPNVSLRQLQYIVAGAGQDDRARLARGSAMREPLRDIAEAVRCAVES